MNSNGKISLVCVGEVYEVGTTATYSPRPPPRFILSVSMHVVDADRMPKQWNPFTLYSRRSNEDMKTELIVTTCNPFFDDGDEWHTDQLPKTKTLFRSFFLHRLHTSSPTATHTNARIVNETIFKLAANYNRSVYFRFASIKSSTARFVFNWFCDFIKWIQLSFSIGSSARVTPRQSSRFSSLTRQQTIDKP